MNHKQKIKKNKKIKPHIAHYFKIAENKRQNKLIKSVMDERQIAFKVQQLD